MIKLTNERSMLKRLALGSVKIAQHRLRRFGRDEDGALIIFALVLFFLMVMMGGVAVDIMRHEAKRTMLSQTLDRAVLAAASLQQRLDPEAVVRDYFAKAGMTEYLNGVTVQQSANSKVVNAVASVDTNPLFMHLVGVDEFNAGATSQAEQRISNVEISMVLDISGSMAGSRIDALKPAAKSFIDTIIAASEPGRVSLSIVPYQSQVILGNSLISQFRLPDPRDHTSSHCLDLPSTAYSSISLSPFIEQQQTGHFDPDSGSSTKTPSTNSYWCKTGTMGAANQITPFSADPVYLKGRVDDMVVGGWTSIDIGMKWGALLLDPDAQPVISGLINAGVVDDQFEGRPVDPDAISVLKVVVLMSDGENTNEYRLRPGYFSGPSNIFKRNSNDSYNGSLTLFHPSRGTNAYYQVRLGRWYSTPDGGTAMNTRLTYQQLWKDYTVRWVAQNIYSRALNGNTSSGANTWFNTFTQNDSDLKNGRLRNVCDAAKAAGIKVFTIGFEAPLNGITALEDCASEKKNKHFFPATPGNIGSVFNGIASQISNLKLTQ